MHDLWLKMNEKITDKSVMCKLCRSFFLKSGSFLIHSHPRRAVSEIIVTLMLLAITVVGGMLIWNIFSGSDAFNIGAIIAIPQQSAGGVKIIGYDTRNGCDLSGISILDNVASNCSSADLDGDKLCTVSCPNNGNDFIVLTVRNPTINSLTINSVQINEIIHDWDNANAGETLSTTSQLPAAGKFKIIPPPNVTPVTIKSSASIEAGSDTQLIIRLSSSINPDIALEKPIKVIIDVSGFEPTTLIILSGSTR